MDTTPISCGNFPVVRARRWSWADEIRVAERERERDSRGCLQQRRFSTNPSCTYNPLMRLPSYEEWEFP